MNLEPEHADDVAERLRRLIVFDAALAVGGGVVTILASLTVARLPALFGVGVAVLVTAAVIASALRPLARGNVSAAALRLAIANWGISIGLAVVTTFAWPMLMLTALLPSAFAVPFVARHEVRAYMVVSFLAALAVACLGLLQDVTGLSAEVAEWVRDLVLLLVAPALTALLVWITLQSNRRLQVALDEQRAARGSLDRQADELRTSRRRVVAATDRERRRIERDLHDGAQSRLIAMNLGLARLRATLLDDPNAALKIVDEIRSEVHLAHAELRDLARGVYPAVLTQHGLAAAIETAADRSNVPVRLSLDDVGRHHGDVEAAIYFCILEALQNAHRHAAASMVNVDLAIANGELIFAVADDGTGFDERSAPGTGLDNMADRLGAVGGELHISSHRSRGTTISGHVPLGD